MPESMRKTRFTRLGAASLLLLTIACSDHGLAPVTDSFIAGTISYVGAWPDTTEWVRIAAFTRVPQSTTEILLNPPTFSDTLSRFVATDDYKLKVPAGRYEWIVLAWKPKLSIYSNKDFSGLDTLGIYFDPRNPTQYGVVNVEEGQTVSGIDIVADFSWLTPPSPILTKQNAEVIAWRDE